MSSSSSSSAGGCWVTRKLNFLRTNDLLNKNSSKVLATNLLVQRSPKTTRKQMILLVTIVGVYIYFFLQQLLIFNYFQQIKLWLISIIHSLINHYEGGNYDHQRLFTWGGFVNTCWSFVNGAICSLTYLDFRGCSCDSAVIS